MLPVVVMCCYQFGMNAFDFQHASVRPPWLHPAQVGRSPPSPSFWAPSPLPVRPPPPTQLPNGRNMLGGGDDPFRPYSQPDSCFGSGYYQMPLPFFASARQAPPQGPPGFDLNNSFVTSGAAYTQGGMAGPSHGYAGYGVPMPYYHMHYHGGRVPMHEPARYSTSSLPSFLGGPYTLFRPYGEGTSHAVHAHLSQAPPSWHQANMVQEMASAAPRSSQRQQFFRQSHFPVHDVDSNDQSMGSVGGALDLPSGSSCGDNAGIVGNTADLEQGGNEDSMGSQEEGSGSEEDFLGSSGPDSSDEEYEELYKRLENAFGKDNLVFKGIKLFMESSRRTNKLVKKAILYMIDHDDDDIDFEFDVSDIDDEEPRREVGESDDNMNMNLG